MEYMIELELKKGAVVLLSDEDAHLKNYTWRVNNHGYVQRHRKVNGEWSSFALIHREVMGLTYGDGLSVDHINHDKLDNRRENLRVVTRAQNNQNREKGYGSSKWRGVSWNKGEGRWVAKAMIAGDLNFLGYFDDEDEAGRAVAKFRAQYMPYSTS